MRKQRGNSKLVHRKVRKYLTKDRYADYVKVVHSHDLGGLAFILKKDIGVLDGSSVVLNNKLLGDMTTIQKLLTTKGRLNKQREAYQKKNTFVVKSKFTEGSWYLFTMVFTNLSESLTHKSEVFDVRGDNFNSDVRGFINEVLDIVHSS